MATEPFSVRRAYLKLSDEELDAIHRPIAKRCLVALYATLGPLSLIVSIAFFQYVSSADPLKHVLLSLVIGCCTFVITLSACTSLRFTLCIADYSYAIAYKRFCSIWHGIVKL